MEKTLWHQQLQHWTTKSPRCFSSSFPSLPQVGHMEMFPGQRKFQSLGWRNSTAGVQLGLEARISSWDTPLDSGGCRSKPAHLSNALKLSCSLGSTVSPRWGKTFISIHDPGVSPLSFHGQLQPWHQLGGCDGDLHCALLSWSLSSF